MVTSMVCKQISIHRFGIKKPGDSLPPGFECLERVSIRSAL
ncbi:hypothetical protein CEV34_1099 [Brucella pseudogrignonensis]|uniref:Uncharacterized protein n=1 Tax=Brucella pseudogrignonensis TaxID=419475 RepID=A0A256GN06_9HYPH|nr:hypothetical protein CEV34_1099 [Brucella pseudogrignonensis]